MSQDFIILIEGCQTDDASFKGVLRRAGYEVRSVPTGEKAISVAVEQPPQLIVFDAVSLTDGEEERCGLVRRRLTVTPIIHIRPAGAPQDDGAGATVYLMKPFTARKLLNRVRTLIPTAEDVDNRIRVGDLVLYHKRGVVAVDGAGEQQLTPRQALLLAELMAYPNELISRQQLMQNVWQTDYLGDTRTLDVHVRWLRQAIEEDPSRPKRLVTVRGKGYMLRVT